MTDIPIRKNGQTILAAWFNLLNTKLNLLGFKPVIVNENYTAGATYKFIMVNASENPVQVTLPISSENAGVQYIVVAVDNTNAITITSASTVDGVATYTMTEKALNLSADGFTDWKITADRADLTPIIDSITNHIATNPAHKERDTKANLVIWAATAENGADAYATDEKKYYGVEDGVLVETGGGGAGGIKPWVGGELDTAGEQVYYTDKLTYITLTENSDAVFDPAKYELFGTPYSTKNSDVSLLESIKMLRSKFQKLSATGTIDSQTVELDGASAVVVATMPNATTYDGTELTIYATDLTNAVSLSGDFDGGQTSIDIVGKGIMKFLAVGGVWKQTNSHINLLGLIEESFVITGYTSADSGSNVKFKTEDSSRSSYGKIFSVDNTGDFTKVTAIGDRTLAVSTALDTNGKGLFIRHSLANGTLVKDIPYISDATVNSNSGGAMTIKLLDGEYISINKTAAGVVTDTSSTWLSVTAIKDNSSSGYAFESEINAETKILSADVSAIGDASDLTFTGLTVGKEYTIGGLLSLNNISGFSIVVQFRSGANGTGTLYGSGGSGTSSGNVLPRNGINTKFIAVSDTLYVYKQNSSGSIVGTGGRDATFVQLTPTVPKNIVVPRVKLNSTEKVVGTFDGGSGEQPLYERSIVTTGSWASGTFPNYLTIDTGLTMWEISGTMSVVNEQFKFSDTTEYISTTGAIYTTIVGGTATIIRTRLVYTKDSENP